MTAQPALHRRLGLGDAVLIGLGSMIGAGVFAVFAPAAGAAGASLLLGLALAGLVAFCNATSSAQLAAQHPTSGGTYVYGREHLGPWWGYAAGWSFLVGKTASCAAMALTFAAYAAPAGWERPVAVAAIVALTAVNCLGVTRTALATRALVVVSLLVLALVVASGVAGVAGGAGADGRASAGGDGTAPPGLAEPFLAGGWYGVLQSAGLLFFAFAGYARIATMGEEVRDPRRTIPRAVVLALSIALVVYAVVAVVVLTALGPIAAAASPEPLADVVRATGWEWAVPVVAVGAATASLGALLALLAGLGRTGLAMAREGDLPRWFAAVDPRFRVPRRMEVGLAAVMCALVLAFDVRDAIAFSSFGVLLYYLVANLAALRQSREWRLFPRALAVIGATLCLVLAATLPWPAVLVGVGVLATGLALRGAAALRRRRG